jgi:hypothetical protein
VSARVSASTSRIRVCQDPFVFCDLGRPGEPPERCSRLARMTQAEVCGQATPRRCFCDLGDAGSRHPIRHLLSDREGITCFDHRLPRQVRVSGNDLFEFLTGRAWALSVLRLLVQADKRPRRQDQAAAMPTPFAVNPAVDDALIGRRYYADTGCPLANADDSMNSAGGKRPTRIGPQIVRTGSTGNWPARKGLRSWT